MKRSLAVPALLWVGLIAPGVLFVAGSGHEANRRWEILAGAVVIGAAVAMRRSRPVDALALGTGFWWALGLLHRDVGSVAVSAWLPAVCVLSYRVGRLPVGPRAVLRGLAPVCVAGTVTGVLVGLTVPVGALLATGLIFCGLLPWLLGRYTRQRYELQLAGWEHARQLEIQQRGRVEQARLRERARIAEDMHDSLGHELNLIALRAAALQIAPDLEDRHRETAGELREGVADAMVRLRDIIGVLREDGVPAPLDPAHAGIGGLVDRVRASGAHVELRRAGAVGELAGMTDKALYRVVQESLTNVMKHAPGAEATVELVHTPGDVTVTVRNGPPPEVTSAGVTPPGATSAAEVHGRRGLIGLRERTRVAGGEFRAAALPDGGFEVRARLPRSPCRTDTVGTEPQDGPPPQAAASGEFTRATTTLRRRLLFAVALPGGLFACLATAMLGYYAYGATSSVLSPSHYAQLEIGAPTDMTRPLLPGNEMSDAPSEYRPEPPATSCHYYRARADLFVTVDVYRLCFADDRLVDKSEITAESRSPADRG